MARQSTAGRAAADSHSLPPLPGATFASRQLRFRPAGDTWYRTVQPPGWNPLLCSSRHRGLRPGVDPQTGLRPETSVPADRRFRHFDVAGSRRAP